MSAINKDQLWIAEGRDRYRIDYVSPDVTYGTKIYKNKATNLTFRLTLFFDDRYGKNHLWHLAGSTCPLCREICFQQCLVKI